MQEEEIVALFRSPAGYLGPLGIDWARSLDEPDKPILLVDEALKGRKNLISGANKEDFHVKNITPGESFHPTAYADLRSVAAGEGCPNCGAPLRIDPVAPRKKQFGQRYAEFPVQHERDQEHTHELGAGEPDRIALGPGLKAQSRGRCPRPAQYS